MYYYSQFQSFPPSSIFYYIYLFIFVKSDHSKQTVLFRFYHKLTFNNSDTKKNTPDRLKTTTC